MLQFSYFVRPLEAAGERGLAVALDQGGELRPVLLKPATRKRPAERLAAELLGLRLARRIGLPTPNAHAVVMGEPSPLWEKGELALGIELLGGAAGAVIETPPAWLVRRRLELPWRPLLAIFSCWLDCRPAPHQVYFRGSGGSPYQAGFVGFGGCLGAGTWRLRPIDPEQAPPECDPSLGDQINAVAELGVDDIAQELHALPEQWLSRVSAERQRALPYELCRRARQLQVRQPEVRRQPRV